MIAEIRGIVPKYPPSYASTHINRAWDDVRRNNLWSFQLYEGIWISPAEVTTGTASVARGSTTVTLNAAAAAAFDASIASETYSPALARQFRVGIQGIYNIATYSTPTITLDRMYGGETDTAASYRIYQCYYPAPVRDHRTWISVKDMTNFRDLFTNKTKEMIDLQDPQRSFFQIPSDVIPYTRDLNSSSSTYQHMLYELWGGPISEYNWQLYGLRHYPDLSDPTDTLPEPITEEVVVERAKRYVYEWAHANSGSTPRNQGPDWKFLQGAADKEYSRLLRDIRRDDRETVMNWFMIRRIGSLYSGFAQFYNANVGTASPGSIW